MDKRTIFQKFVAFTASVHQITNDMTKDVKTESITPVQYKIMEYIAIHTPVTLSTISDCMHMSMPNTSRELKKLNESDLCEKIPDLKDGRKQYIRLTSKGEAMMNEAFRRIEARFAKRMEGLTEDELKEIEHALEVLQHKVFFEEDSIKS